MRRLNSLRGRGNGRTEPKHNTLNVDNPASNEMTCGLIPVHGWAFVNGSSAPEGTVEAWVEGYDRVVAHDRFPIGGIDPSNAWAARGGFRNHHQQLLLAQRVAHAARPAEESR